MKTEFTWMKSSALGLTLYVYTVPKKPKFDSSCQFVASVSKMAGTPSLGGVAGREEEGIISSVCGQCPGSLRPNRQINVDAYSATSR